MLTRLYSILTLAHWEDSSLLLEVFSAILNPLQMALAHSLVEAYSVPIHSLDHLLILSLLEAYSRLIHSLLPQPHPQAVFLAAHNTQSPPVPIPSSVSLSVHQPAMSSPSVVAMQLR